MHRATTQFWKCYHNLADDIRRHADKSFGLLRGSPEHPSLHFKKVGPFWSARIDISHRALAVEDGSDFIWVWIETHDEYEKLIRGR